MTHGHELKGGNVGGGCVWGGNKFSPQKGGNWTTVIA